MPNRVTGLKVNQLTLISSVSSADTTHQIGMGDIMRYFIHWRMVLYYQSTQEFLLRKSSPGKRQREEEKPGQQGDDSAR
jgi:hypothetical protein